MRENNKIIVVVGIILVLICGIIVFNIGDREHNNENGLKNKI